MNDALLSGLKQELEANGFAKIFPICEEELIRRCLSEVSIAFAKQGVISVDADDIVLKTLNGAALVTSCPSVQQLYDLVLAGLRRVFQELKELKDRTVGISSNLLSNGDRFRLHFDRNQLTVVVYLNDLDDLPLTLYPRVRRDPIKAGVKDPFDLGLVRSETVYPLQNLAIIFEGRRTFHGIISDQTQKPIAKKRYSLQFAFDFDYFDYSGQNYYGESSQL